MKKPERTKSTLKTIGNIGCDDAHDKDQQSCTDLAMGIAGVEPRNRNLIT